MQSSYLSFRCRSLPDSAFESNGLRVCILLKLERYYMERLIYFYADLVTILNINSNT